VVATEDIEDSKAFKDYIGCRTDIIDFLVKYGKINVAIANRSRSASLRGRNVTTYPAIRASLGLILYELLPGKIQYLGLQKVQLSQRCRATLKVVENFAKDRSCEIASFCRACLSFH